MIIHINTMVKGMSVLESKYICENEKCMTVILLILELSQIAPLMLLGVTRKYK